MSDTSTPEYRYRDVPLRASIASELIGQLFAGTRASREDIVQAVISAHRRGGGLSAKNPSSVIKKALANLRHAECAENISKGIWDIFERAADQPDVAAISDLDAAVEHSDDSETISPEITVQASTERGSGSGTVYVYYLPTYKKLADVSGISVWPCKIGLTSLYDHSLRITLQAATALPERPFIALALRTDRPRDLEKAIHGVLAFRGRRIEDVPGVEWFRTNPDEVEGIYTWCSESQATFRAHGPAPVQGEPATMAGNGDEGRGAR
jgi:hypothetical protein